MTTAICALFSIGFLVRLLRGWGWSGIRALATHPPLGPYAPRWWWEDGLLRFTKTAWKALLVIQTLFLSALVGADLRDPRGREITAQWLGSMRLATGVVALFLLLGLVAGAALQIWRINTSDDWPYPRRTIGRCFAPVFPLTVLLLAGWAAILT